MKYLLSFMQFIVAFNKMALSLWKTRIKFETKEIIQEQMIILYYHPELIANPDAILSQIKKEFVDAYKILHGKEPIVITLPLGYLLKSLNMDEFVSILPSRSREDLKTAIYRRKDRIEIIKKSDLNGVNL